MKLVHGRREAFEALYFGGTPTLEPAQEFRLPDIPRLPFSGQEVGEAFMACSRFMCRAASRLITCATDSLKWVRQFAVSMAAHYSSRLHSAVFVVLLYPAWGNGG